MPRIKYKSKMKEYYKKAGIQLFGGLSGAADAAVADYLAGKLVFDPDIHCTHHDHDEGRTCGSHCGDVYKRQVQGL